MVARHKLSKEPAILRKTPELQRLTEVYIHKMTRTTSLRHISASHFLKALLHGQHRQRSWPTQV